ncbi:helix-turn-helix transcriptional regulator [Colwellia psychrerythraea]|nr:AraC family transcriptional regulator [Colwellia psychrerythraea]
MRTLINAIKVVNTQDRPLPFAVYSSIKEQHLLNVPVVKPLFIAVLDGDKKLGKDGEIVCRAGDFIFLSDSPAINMRNIPKEKEYYALLIEFEYEDFLGIGPNVASKQYFTKGEIPVALEKCLQQFVEWSLFAPKELWSIRRKEILHLLYHLGHTDILAMATPHKLGQKIHALFSEKPSAELSLTTVCQQVAMSESTLRRKLAAEGTTVQEIKDQVKLGLGLHLLQTTNHAIVYIAEQCGYQSQSRFTSRFKERFGLTPSALRKTKKNVTE